LSQPWHSLLWRSLPQLGTPKGPRAAEAPIAEALMEEGPSTLADTPVSKVADIHTEALATEATLPPLTWAADSRTADGRMAAGPQSPEDFRLVLPAISRAILTQEETAWGRHQALATSVASELRMRWCKVLVVPWVSGSPLETRAAGPCSRRLTLREMRWAAGGIPLAT
jgi:hypothetical protein